MVNFKKKITNSSKFKAIPLEFVNEFPRGICGIYKIQNSINGKCYIGQSINIRHRLFQHVLSANRNNIKSNKLYQAIRKYGIENFICSVLCSINIENRDSHKIKNELNVMEVLYISEYDSYANGYNSTMGGDSGRLGYRHSIDTIQKMRISAKSRSSEISSINSKSVFCYDLNGKIYYDAESISEMSRKTGANYRSIGQICNNEGGRFMANKRFLFSFSKEDLERRIKYIVSGQRDIDMFLKRSNRGKSNKNKKYKSRGKF